MPSHCPSPYRGVFMPTLFIANLITFASTLFFQLELSSFCYPFEFVNFTV
jgi:hypothetical protein